MAIARAVYYNASFLELYFAHNTYSAVVDPDGA